LLGKAYLFALVFRFAFFAKIFCSYSIEPVSRTGVIGNNIGSEKAFADVLIKFVQRRSTADSIRSRQTSRWVAGRIPALTLARLVVWSAHAAQRRAELGQVLVSLFGFNSSQFGCDHNGDRPASRLADRYAARS
jgi:hypothetical protein